MNIVFLDRTSIPASHDIPRPSFPHTWTEYDRTLMAILKIPATNFAKFAHHIPKYKIPGEIAPRKSATFYAA